MRTIFLCLTILFGSTTLLASDRSTRDSSNYSQLAGDLPGIVTKAKSPYLIIADIYVPQGQTVIIEPGTVFMFKSFTTLQVQGALLAKGKKDAPIVFTSVNDPEYNKSSSLDPAPYDWNGITVHPEAIGTNISFCAVLYSVYGINSMTRFIRIDPCLFLHNGRSNCVIEGKDQPVTEEPFVYALSVKDPSLQGVPLTILRDPQALRRNTLRYGGALATIGAGVFGVMYNSKYTTSHSHFVNLSSDNPSNLAQHSTSEWQNVRNEYHTNRSLMFLGYGLSIIGLFGFGISFTF